MSTATKQQTTPAPGKLLPWLPVLLASLCALAFFVLLLISLISRANLPVGVGLLILIVGLQVILLDRRIQQNWLEVELLTLVFLGLAIWQLTSSTTSSKPFKYPSSETDNASFTLPADKIQSDLTVLQPNSNVMLVLVSDHAVQQYNVTLTGIKGVGPQDHKPPYNKDAVEVDVRLPQGINGDTAANFASQLQSVKSIYLFPSTSPTSNPILNSPNFALPINKIGSDLNGLKPGNVVVVLLVNNQMQFYTGIVTRVTPTSVTPTPTPTPASVSTPTPTPTSQPGTVGIQLVNTPSDTALDFANQLPNATTIYLLQ